MIATRSGNPTCGSILVWTRSIGILTEGCTRVAAAPVDCWVTAVASVVAGDCRVTAAASVAGGDCWVTPAAALLAGDDRVTAGACVTERIGAASRGRVAIITEPNSRARRRSAVSGPGVGPRVAIIDLQFEGAGE
jgi:hypothetical protein